jgi:hypothetical protein
MFKSTDSNEAISKKAKDKIIDRVSKYLEKTVAFQKDIELHYLKVILSLKKFNTKTNYKNLDKFMWRQFSYNV